MKNGAVYTTMGCIVVLTLSVTTAVGQGDKGHAEDKMSAHMQAMHALKEQIPEEYRIMERTPLLPTDQSLVHGEAAYKRHCAECHGHGGRGDGPAARGLPTPPANFLDLQHSAVYGPGEKFWIIGNGSSTTGMPPFPQLDLRTRWNLVNFIYSLQETKALPQQGHHHH